MEEVEAKAKVEAKVEGEAATVCWHREDIAQGHLPGGGGEGCSASNAM